MAGADARQVLLTHPIVIEICPGRTEVLLWTCCLLMA
jgi:hypothetical protein